MLDRLKRYAATHQLQIEWDALRGLDDLDLVNVLATMLPLGVEDKQAIVESVTLEERARVLSALLEISQAPFEDGPGRPH